MSQASVCNTIPFRTFVTSIFVISRLSIAVRFPVLESQASNEQPEKVKSLNPLYTLQPVVQPDRLYNRLHRVYRHFPVVPTGCMAGCMNSTCLIHATQHPTVLVVYTYLQPVVRYANEPSQTAPAVA